MKKALIFALSSVIGFGLVGCGTTEKVPDQKEVMMDSIKGNISYRERVALPPNAVVTVTLEDVSLMDVAAKKMAEQTFTTDGTQVPFDFELSYDANQIEAKHRYSVRATIRVNGSLRFTTDTANQVITDAAKTKQVNLNLIAVR
ncbi:YbaY family lipoprotein [Vibrio algarum]|uniref:YbaY family lipoprotein n=1 Tax=Vibrio algarum TaxID=3020714 RepID=A0ABT4YPI6_9VIBR|nr:YbaY family lipoprotein [Vibrio sp. KJ40-1]MDB1123473.1 YbaY family lipoprotein [Vibrio sp. KJ40-1]